MLNVYGTQIASLMHKIWSCDIQDYCPFGLACEGQRKTRGKGIYALQRSVPKGGFIYLDASIEGETSPGAVLVIVCGTVALMCTRETEERVLLGLLTKGHSLGQLNLFMPFQRPLYARAKTDVCLCIVPEEDAERAIRSDPHVAEQTIRKLGEQFWMTQEMLKIRAQEDSSRRMAMLLHYLGTIYEYDGEPLELPLTQNDLAALVGLNRVTVSRLLGELERGGFIQRGHGKLTLLRLPERRSGADCGVPQGVERLVPALEYGS